MAPEPSFRGHLCHCRKFRRAAGFHRQGSGPQATDQVGGRAMRRLGGAFVAALFSVAIPAAAQHVHHAAATAPDTGSVVAAAKPAVAAPTLSPAPGTLTAPNNLVTLATTTA